MDRCLLESRTRDICLHSGWSGESYRFGAKITGWTHVPSVFQVFAIMFLEWKFPTGLCVFPESERKEMLMWAFSETTQQEGLGQTDGNSYLFVLHTFVTRELKTHFVF